MHIVKGKTVYKLVPRLFGRVVQETRGTYLTEQRARDACQSANERDEAVERQAEAAYASLHASYYRGFRGIFRPNPEAAVR